MGSAKERMMDDAEERRDAEIAEQLGITLDELYQTSWEIADDETSDGAVIGHRIEFSPDSPKHILDKVVGLDESNSVSVEFDNSDDDDSEEDNDTGDEPIWQDMNSEIAKSITNSLNPKKDNENN